MSHSVFAFVIVCQGVLTPADEGSKRDLRHKLFVETVSGLEITSTDASPLNVNNTPVLRYYNPVRGRSNDGEMFVLTDDTGVPRVVTALSLRNDRFWIEAASISGQPLEGELPGFGDWKPEVGGSGHKIEKQTQGNQAPLLPFPLA